MRKQVWKWLGLVLLFAASAFGIWKTIYLSADIDESYAVTLGIRLISGDRLFRDMWEVHQTSGVLYAPLLAVYKWLFHGTEGILVYLRILGIVIQGAISVYSVYVMKKWVSPFFSVLISLLYFNFTPKQIQSPEFTQFLYWGIMVLGLSLLQYWKNKKRVHVVVAAISLCVCILAYPYGIILFPFVVGILAIIWKGNLRDNADNRKEKYKAIGMFTGVCGLLGVLFLLYVLQGVSFPEWMENISCVFMDESHEQSLKEMWLGHFQALGEMLLPTFLVILLAQLLLRTGNKVTEKGAGSHRLSGWDASDSKRNLILGIASILQAGLFLYQFHTIVKVNFTMLLPLIIQLVVFLLYVYWIMTGNRVVKTSYTQLALESEDTFVTPTENDMLLILLGTPSLVAFVTVLCSSNLSANYSTGFLMPFLFALMMAVARTWSEREQAQKGKIEMGKSRRCCMAGLCILAVVFAVQLFATRMFLVRFTSTQRKNIFDGYYETNHGPLKGIRLGDLDYDQYEGKTLLLSSLVSQDEVFLYVGCDMFLYSQFEGTIGTGNTISTPVFGEQLLAYYDKYPERIPDIFFVDREYVADFSSALQQEPFASFVKTKYRLDTSYEGSPVSVYRRVSK